MIDVTDPSTWPEGDERVRVDKHLAEPSKWGVYVWHPFEDWGMPFGTYDSEAEANDAAQTVREHMID